ncbi:MAG TPA: ferrochelatase, partial [Thermoplasmata archaeon]|nr:ferrochelatase [Thermoplasmata archaeon]
MTGGSATGTTAILLMGYGSPSGPEELPGYLTEVLGGRPPSPEMVDEYRRRYAVIGGSPQPKVLASLREKLERQLRESRTPRPVYLGTKHWTPHVAEVIPRIVADGHTRVIAIPLSPYASTWILEPYRRALDQGIRNAGGAVEVELRTSWHLDPHLIGYWSRAIREELAHVQDTSRCVLLSAHSLPRRLGDRGDPYPRLLTETATAIASAAGLDRWAFSYQSAGNTTEPWLGPDLADVMRDWRE